ELFNLKRTSSQVFESENLVCLITGEGPFEAATSVATLLGQQKYHEVINLGIAGSLSDEYAVGSIHPVRSVYLVIDGKPQFKSFKSFEQGLDCVTSFERILNPEKALPLTGLAHLVDREAWGVAMAAKTLAVPFHSYKLISDQAGSLGACEVVREKADEWSQKLALHLRSILIQEEKETHSYQMDGFHFTFTTQHQFEQLLKKMSLRDELTQDEVFESLPLKKIIGEIPNPKLRAKALLSYMEGKLDPLKDQLEAGLQNWKSRFEKNGISLQTDQTWENPEIKVSFNISSDEDLKQKINSLSELKVKPFTDLRNGTFHVE
nr:hypothetical protein [Bdellovibrionales bacterium]